MDLFNKSNALKGFNLLPPLRLVFLMWLLFSIQQYTHYDLAFFGIFPRTFQGLIGIIFSPLIHGNLGHISSNSISILVLGGSIYLFYPQFAPRVFIQCYFFTNFFVWLFARPFYHIGASGLVYGLALFLVSMGFFQREAKSIIISILVLLGYGSLIYGLISIDQNISWESHLMGAIVGVGSAFGIRKSKID